MGFAASWICARGLTLASALEALDLVETGQAAEPWRTPFSCAELPGGWLAITSTNPDWMLPQKVQTLSTGGPAVGCFMSDYVMNSGACAYEQGKQVWWVLHEPEEGITNLTHGGKPPARFETLLAKALKDHEAYTPDPHEVDFVFDVPIDLAVSICGFRPDDDPPEGVAFKELRPKKGRGSGLFGKLSGLFVR